MELDYKLYLGDSAEVLKGCPDETIDLVVTSPPYDNLRTYNGYTFDFEAIADQLARVLKPGGVIVWVVNDATVNGSETGSSFKQALYFKSIGLNLHDTMIWDKLSFADVASLKIRYAPVFEYMFVFSKGSPKSFNPLKDRPNKHAGAKNHGTKRYPDGSVQPKTNSKVIAEYGQRFNIWSIPNPGKAGNLHPATFPLKLALDHIQSWSNPGDTVLDPFLGSGTTGVAALQLGRKFRGIEISEEYLQIAEERIGQSGTEICIQEKADTVSQ
jgi:DNA modification methylase